MSGPIKALAPDPKPEPVNPTDAMIEQDHQMWALWLKWGAALDHLNAIGGTATDEQFAAASEIAQSIERQMTDTPSGSPLGAAVKLAIWEYRIRETRNEHIDALAKSATADAQRLAGVVLIREPGASI